MTLEQLIARHGFSPDNSVPEWMLGCFRRRCISFADGRSDNRTIVYWVQSRNFTIDLRLPQPSDQVAAKPIEDYTLEELAILANYEGWVADARWDGTQLEWTGGTAFQVTDRWPEVAHLHRVGNCLIEFAPSGAYVEDWRLQPTRPGPFVGLKLVQEYYPQTDLTVARQGGLIVCGDHAAMVLGRGSPMANQEDPVPQQVAAAGDDATRLEHLLDFEASVATVDALGTPTVRHSTRPERPGQPLLPEGKFDYDAATHRVLQRFIQNGQECVRVFEIDVLEASNDFPLTTSSTEAAQAWYAECPNTGPLYGGAHMTALAARKEGFRPLPTDGFRVPKQFRGNYVLLVPAAPEWVDLDFAAVTASRHRIKHLFGPRDDWPPVDLDLALDRDDLNWHRDEFETRHSFAYHLLSHDREECQGCLYLYPTASRDHDAEAYLWTHAALEKHYAANIEQEVIDWVHQQWPFAAVAWPGRFIPFDEWEDAAIPNYYACTRMASAESKEGC